MKNEYSGIKRVIKFMLKNAAEKKPVLFFVYFLILIRDLLNKAQTVLLPKFLIDELVAVYNGESVEIHIKNAIIYAGLTILCSFIASFVDAVANRIRGLVSEWFDEYFSVQVTDAAMALDYELTEDPHSLDQLTKARDGITHMSGNVCGILNEFFNIINNIVIFIGVIAIIFTTAPWIFPVEVIGVAVTAIINKKIRRIEIWGFFRRNRHNRAFSYLLYELSDFIFGKDIRLYNSAGLFNKKSEERLDSQIETWREQVKQSQKQEYKLNIISALSNFFEYTYVGLLVLFNKITLGSFSMCTSAAQTLTQSCNGIVRSIQEIIKRSQYAEEYIKFTEYKSVITYGNEKIKEGKEHSIEFKNVSFKYPRSDEFILENVSIKIPYGQHLAVVGLNGAGKTTFIKLLCRLYDVTSGEILIDDINIKEYSKEEYRKLLAVLFQDFKILAFSVKENISFGDEVPDSQIEEVLKLSGLWPDIKKMPKKLNTNIAKSFDKEGVEFSGGQKQKLGISRSLYKDSPIVILDEPTAALDPIAEAEIYEDFNKMVGGKTAIYISHRLSSCKFCDKIAVFSNKNIQEYGTHNELMAIKDGIYNQMFTTQAKQYRNC